MNTLAAVVREHGWARTLTAVARLGRPKFLLGGFALYGLGALAALTQGATFAPTEFWLGQLAVTMIQLTTHYSNDYFDYHADLANHTPTRWSGGSRVLVQGELPRGVALAAAVTAAGLALVTLCVLALRLHVPDALVILLSMLFLAWSYSSPPLRLHTRGLGEPTVAVVVPLLTPLSAFVIQTGELSWYPILLSIPLCFLQLAMLLTLEFPDAAGDSRVGKRSWTVVFGARAVARLSAAFIVLAFSTSFASAALGIPDAVVWAWLCLTPLGGLQLLRTLAGGWRRRDAWESLCFGSVALFFFAIVCDLIGLYHYHSAVS